MVTCCLHGRNRLVCKDSPTTCQVAAKLWKVQWKWKQRPLAFEVNMLVAIVRHTFYFKHSQFMVCVKDTCQQPLINQLGITHFSLVTCGCWMVTIQYLDLLDWGLSHNNYSTCKFVLILMSWKDIMLCCHYLGWAQEWLPFNNRICNCVQTVGNSTLLDFDLMFVWNKKWKRRFCDVMFTHASTSTSLLRLWQHN